jgi:hypothetical protein
MSGHGILIFKNGEVFEGEFSEGGITGQGTFKTNTKNEITGMWENGLIKQFEKLKS